MMQVDWIGHITSLLGGAAAAVAVIGALVGWLRRNAIAAANEAIVHHTATCSVETRMEKRYQEILEELRYLRQRIDALLERGGR